MNDVSTALRRILKFNAEVKMLKTKMRRVKIKAVKVAFVFL